jgi:hypothetical protein
MYPESAGSTGGRWGYRSHQRHAPRSVDLVVSARQDDWMLIVRATKKLLQRVGQPTLQDGEHSTTLLGEWYATALL